MKDYDVIVIGSGTGLNLVFRALSLNMKVALVARDYVGGTCLNVGCVPSKMLMYAADIIMDLERARKLGITADAVKINFDAIIKRTKVYISQNVTRLKETLKSEENLDFYEAECEFTDNYILNIDGEHIKGNKIFIASGARPFIPPIKGLDGIDYLTNENLLNLDHKPASIVIIGGSYIGVEYAHFFAAMGCKVTIVEMNASLIPFEEPEISALLKQNLERRMTIYTDTTAQDIAQTGNRKEVHLKNNSTGEATSVSAEAILVATGRVSNADRLRVSNSGIETGKGNFIKVNEYLMTTKDNIWAIGDAVGRQMFTHAGDREAKIAWINATEGKKLKMHFDEVPHAVFTSPQIASIGLTESEARKTHDVLIGRADYADIVQGDARAEEDGFAKAVVDKQSRRILGFHIIGPEAPELIQEVVNAVANGMSIDSITGSMHIFPALSELIPEALGDLQ